MGQDLCPNLTSAATSHAASYEPRRWLSDALVRRRELAIRAARSNGVRMDLQLHRNLRSRPDYRAYVSKARRIVLAFHPGLVV